MKCNDYEFGTKFITLKNKLDAHIQASNNPHNVTKEQVGLGNVDNIAAIDLPISAETREYIDSNTAFSIEVDQGDLGVVTVSLKNAEGAIISSGEFDMDSELAISSASLDLERKLLVFNRVDESLPPMLCDISELVDEYHSLIEKEIADRKEAINRVNTIITEQVTALHNTDLEHHTRIKTIENDYLKSADKEELNKRIDDIIELKHSGPISFTKLSDYLYEADYEDLAYSAGEEEAKKALPVGGCSAIWKQTAEGVLLARSFDWFYDKSCTFKVHVTKGVDNKGRTRYESWGIAGGNSSITTDNVLDLTDPAYLTLPFFMLDGMNENGVVCENNVVHNYLEGEGEIRTIPTGDVWDEVSMIALPRYILDYATSARQICDDIKQHVVLVCPEVLKQANYICHYLVADKNECFVIEVTREKTIIAREFTKLFNFEQRRLELNDDGSVYTPATQTITEDAINSNKIDIYGAGLERWNIANAAYDAINDEASMLDLIYNKLCYRQAYGCLNDENEAKPENVSWWTEYTGTNAAGESLYVNSHLDTFKNRKIDIKAAAAFNARNREEAGPTWHTTHASLYNLTKRTFEVYSQSHELEEAHAKWDTNPLQTEIERAMAEEARLNGEIENTNAALHFVDEKLDEEINRAKGVESDLNTTCEGLRDADERIRQYVVGFEERTIAKDAELEAAISTETEARIAGEHDLSVRIDNEEVRATAAETKLTNDLNTHVSNLSNQILSVANKAGEWRTEEVQWHNDLVAKDVELEEAIRWEKGEGDCSNQTKGTLCEATGVCSVAEGMNTHAGATASHSEGGLTATRNDYDEETETGFDAAYSHVEGFNNATNNVAEHAEGKFGWSYYDENHDPAKSSIHFVGIGTNNQDEYRKDAEVIMINGDKYLLGVGGYDGKDIENVKTVQEVINNKSNATNLEDGSGTKAIQQKQDGTSGTFDFTGKNPNAYKLDPTLDGELNYGAIGDYSSSFGGKGQASGKRSFQVGTTTIAKGNYSFASGDNSVALGNDSSANNYQTVAAGTASFSTGYSTQVTGTASFVSGTRNKVDGGNAAAFGNDNNADHNNQFVIGHFNDNKVGTLLEIGNGSDDEHRSNAFEVYEDGHAEIALQGNTKASLVRLDTVEGYAKSLSMDNTTYTLTLKDANGNPLGESIDLPLETMVVNGRYDADAKAIILTLKNDQTIWIPVVDLISGLCTANNLMNGTGAYTLTQPESRTFTLGETTYNVDATGKAAIVLNGKAAAIGSRSFASGSSTVALGDYSHTEGVNTFASGNQSHAEGNGTQATNASTHAEGISAIASGEGAHAEGNFTEASGASSHAEGNNTVASGGSAHAEGTGTTASKTNAHAEGLSTIANGIAAHAEGKETTVSNDYAHAEGIATIASAVGSHAEGYQSKATGYYAHAQGNNCEAHGQGSFATGHGNVAWQDYQTVVGTYNKNKTDTLFEVGNGTGSASNLRSNAFEVLKDNGGIRIGNTVLTEQQLIKLLALLDAMEVINN